MGVKIRLFQRKIRISTIILLTCIWNQTLWFPMRIYSNTHGQKYYKSVVKRCFGSSRLLNYVDRHSRGAHTFRNASFLHFFQSLYFVSNYTFNLKKIATNCLKLRNRRQNIFILMLDRRSFSYKPVKLSKCHLHCRKK